jgi:hypothetical protein
METTRDDLEHVESRIPGAREFRLHEIALQLRGTTLFHSMVGDFRARTAWYKTGKKVIDGQVGIQILKGSPYGMRVVTVYDVSQVMDKPVRAAKSRQDADTIDRLMREVERLRAENTRLSIPDDPISGDEVPDPYTPRDKKKSGGGAA